MLPPSLSLSTSNHPHLFIAEFDGVRGCRLGHKGHFQRARLELAHDLENVLKGVAKTTQRLSPNHFQQVSHLFTMKKGGTTRVRVKKWM